MHLMSVSLQLSWSLKGLNNDQMLAEEKVQVSVTFLSPLQILRKLVCKYSIDKLKYLSAFACWTTGFKETESTL